MGDVPADPVAAIEEGLATLGTEYQDAFAQAGDELALREAYAHVLGKKKGALTKVLALMRHVPGPDRPKVGAKVNTFKQGVEDAFAERLSALEAAARDADLNARPWDLTLPGRLPTGRGHLHPVMQTQDDLLAIFRDLGFEVVPGPDGTEAWLRKYC